MITTILSFFSFSFFFKSSFYFQLNFFSLCLNERAVIYFKLLNPAEYKAAVTATYFISHV